MTETAPARTRKPYMIRSPETWDLVRTHYIRGATAASLAVQFGVSVENIRKKATREGWTRKAQAAIAGAALRGAPVAAEDGALDPPADPSGAGARFGEPEPLDPLYEAEEVAALALGAVARCLQQGKYADAERMGRLAETMNRLARPPEPAKRPASETFHDEPEVEMSEEKVEALRKRVEKRVAEVADDLREKGLLDRILALRSKDAVEPLRTSG